MQVEEGEEGLGDVGWLCVLLNKTNNVCMCWQCSPPDEQLIKQSKKDIEQQADYNDRP